MQQSAVEAVHQQSLCLKRTQRVVPALRVERRFVRDQLLEPAEDQRSKRGTQENEEQKL